MPAIISEALIREVPKTDLHVHLDGSLRLSTLIELAKAEKVKLPSYDEAELKAAVFPDTYKNLAEYLACFGHTCSVLNRPENIERVACELAEDNIREGVRYMEVRLAPQLHVSTSEEISGVVQAVTRGMERARKEHNDSKAVSDARDLPFEYGIILCAMRCFNEHMGPYFSRLIGLLKNMPDQEMYAVASLEMARSAVDLRDKEGLPVVGFDIAGEEAGYPASSHKAAYHCAHSHFLGKTVHSGEAYGPESVFQAISQCHADRIGHGTLLFDHHRISDPSILDPKTHVDRLVEYIASRRITIEVCLTSNMQTIPAYADESEHPVHKMLDYDMAISICTDNRLVSSTTVSQELSLLVNNHDISLRQFRNIIMAGFKGSFFPHEYGRKRAYVRKAMDFFDQAAHRHGFATVAS